jgi:hypothetical protein
MGTAFLFVIAAPTVIPRGHWRGIHVDVAPNVAPRACPGLRCAVPRRPAGAGRSALSCDPPKRKSGSHDADGSADYALLAQVPPGGANTNCPYVRTIKSNDFYCCA